MDISYLAPPDNDTWQIPCSTKLYLLFNGNTFKKNACSHASSTVSRQMNRKTNRLESFTTVKPVPDAETATQTVPIFTLGPPPSISQTNEAARVGAVGAFSGQICIPINGQNPNHQTKVSLSISIDILHFLSLPFSFFFFTIL